MKVLVTGARGQLGSAIADIVNADPGKKEISGKNFICIDIEDLDMTDLKAVEEYLNTTKPDVIINCAAYTAVDKSEQEPDKAFLLNGKMPSVLASFCRENNSLLIHISTDYIFDGKNYRPYNEDDKPAPGGAYGASKLEGEENILKVNPSCFIIRTSWLYYEKGLNFVRTIYSRLLSGSPLRVVCDQVGTPTYAGDLAGVVLQFLDKKPAGTEIFNYSNEGAVSWYDFAHAIAEIAGINDTAITPVETREYPTPAKRPFYSVLNKRKIRESGTETIYWRTSLEKCMKKIKETNNK